MEKDRNTNQTRVSNRYRIFCSRNWEVERARAGNGVKSDTGRRIDGFCILGCGDACCEEWNGTGWESKACLLVSTEGGWFPLISAYYSTGWTHQLMVQLSILLKEMIVMATKKALTAHHLTPSRNNQRHVTSHSFLLTDRAFSHLLTWYNTAIFQNVRGHYLKHSGARKARCSCEQCMKFF